MSKLFLLFFSLFLYSTPLIFPYHFELKKDEFLKMNFYYYSNIYPFEFRWTLFKNNILTTLYRYDNFPRQIELYKNPPLNMFRVEIANFFEINPYFTIEFLEFNKQKEVASFVMRVYNFKEVRAELKKEKVK